MPGPAPPLQSPQSAGSVQRLLSGGQRLGFASAYDSRGTSYLHRGEYEYAVRDFTAAVGLVDDEPRFYTNRALAMVLVGLGRRGPHGPGSGRRARRSTGPYSGWHKGL